MVGVIADRQVLSHIGLIWSEFGARCVARCIGAVLRGKPTTFLNIALQKPPSHQKSSRRAAP